MIRERGYDSVSGRAFTGSARKAWLLARAAAEETITTGVGRVDLRGDLRGDEDGPLPETAFLVDAAAA